MSSRIFRHRNSNRSAGSVPGRFCGKRRGSTMVEAAIYFPIAVLAAMVVLILMIHLYEQSCIQADLHGALRMAADAETGKTAAFFTFAAARDRYRTDAENVDFEQREEQSGMFKVFTGETETQVFGNRLTSPAGYSFVYAGKAYAIDENVLVRLREAAEGIL